MPLLILKLQEGVFSAANRIIEIAVGFFHDGQKITVGITKVVGPWQGCSGHFITGLTGIEPPELLEGAPTFAQVADRIAGIAGR